MPIRPRVLQFGVETAHQRLSDSLIGPQSEAETAIGHVSGTSGAASLRDSWTVPVMRDLHMGERRAVFNSVILEVQGGIRGGETRDTKPSADLVFRDTALSYPRPTIKTSARRTRCCKSRDLAQTRARQLLLNQTVADCLILHCFRCKYGGLESSSRLPWCDGGLIRPSILADRCDHGSQSCTRVSYTIFQLAKPAVPQYPDSWKTRLQMQPSRLSLIWFATGWTNLTPVSRRPHVRPGPRGGSSREG